MGGNKAEDLYLKSRVQLDVSASYVINQRLRVFAEMLNLTKQPFEAYMGSKDLIVQREFYNFWGRLGVKFDLKAKR